MKARRVGRVLAILLGGLLPVVAAGCGDPKNTAKNTASNPGASVDVGVTVSLDVGTRYQVMQGFGASVAFYANWLTEHPRRDAIYQAVFADLGLQILRVGNWYQNSSGSAFADSVAVVQAARASLGAGPLVLLSSWSPPASLKSNLDTKNGGTLGSMTGGGGYRYADFGAWWAASVAAYADAGVTADFMSLQNEPDFKASYESCLFDPTEGTNAGYDRALDAVFAATSGLAVPPRILGPEVSGIGGPRIANYLAPLMAEPLVGDLAGIAHHLYSGGTAAFPSSYNVSMMALAGAATAANKPLFMTEFSPSSGADMFNTAWLIHNAVTVEGVGAYLYWGLTWAPPTSGPPSGLVTTENPFDQTEWKTPNGYAINDVYYAVRHFSKWIGVGWRRVAIATTAAAPVNASAFVSPDGQQATIVLLNTDTSAHTVTIDAGSFGFSSSAVYRTSGTDERTTPTGPVDGPVMMPGRSLVTVTLGA